MVRFRCIDWSFVPIGEQTAAHKAAKAAYEQQVYAYEKKILEVFKEVNNALVTYRKSREMRRSGRCAVPISALL